MGPISRIGPIRPITASASAPSFFNYNCLDNYRLDDYNPIMKAESLHSTRLSRRFDSLEQEVFLNLWRTYDRLRTFEDELFSRFDLTPQQYNALRLLKSDHPA